MQSLLAMNPDLFQVGAIRPHKSGSTQTQQLSVSPDLHILKVLQGSLNAGSLEPQEEGGDEDLPPKMRGDYEVLYFSPCNLCKM